MCGPAPLKKCFWLFGGTHLMFHQKLYKNTKQYSYEITLITKQKIHIKRTDNAYFRFPYDDLTDDGLIYKTAYTFAVKAILNIQITFLFSISLHEPKLGIIQYFRQTCYCFSIIDGFMFVSMRNFMSSLLLKFPFLCVILPILQEKL